MCGPVFRQHRPLAVVSADRRIGNSHAQTEYSLQHSIQLSLAAPPETNDQLRTSVEKHFITKTILHITRIMVTLVRANFVLYNILSVAKTYHAEQPRVVLTEIFRT